VNRSRISWRKYLTKGGMSGERTWRENYYVIGIEGKGIFRCSVDAALNPVVFTPIQFSASEGVTICTHRTSLTFDLTSGQEEIPRNSNKKNLSGEKKEEQQRRIPLQDGQIHRFPDSLTKRNTFSFKHRMTETNLAGLQSREIKRKRQTSSRRDVPNSSGTLRREELQSLRAPGPSWSHMTLMWREGCG